MREDNQGIVSNWVNLGEERLADVVNLLLKNENFVEAMQGAIVSGLSAKKNLDKNVVRILEVANIPTLEDVQQVREKMEELEDVLSEVYARVRQLDKNLK